MNAPATIAFACFVVMLLGATDSLAQKLNPKAKLVEPERGERRFVAPATIPLEAEVTVAAGRSIARVEFFAADAPIGQATAAPYAINWSNVPVGEYRLRVRATDSQGATDWSPYVRVRVLENRDPRVRLIEPGQDAQFSSPASILLRAQARDRDHNLARVEFYVDGALVGSSTTEPYSLSWGPVPGGAHVLLAKAIDAMGATDDSRPVRISVSGNNAPAVNLTSPANGTLFGAPGPITLEATATDADGDLARVDFYAGASLIGTATASPYAITWANTVAGTYALAAQATDGRGFTTRSAAVSVIVNAGPTVSLTAPASGTVVQAPGSVLLSADAADTDGKVTKVDFYQGSTLIGTATAAPYTVPVSNLTAGTYSFTAAAADDRGGVTTSSATTVIVNSAPLASLTSPTPNAVFTAPANIPISADVVDPDGTVSSVEFYFGTTLIATKTTPPYSIEWTGVPQGTYSLSARALDNNGGIVSSGTVSITVNSGALKLYFIHVDHLNTPRLIADDQQRTVWRWDQQEPFGVNVPDENPSGLGTFEFPLRLPGQQFDKETNLHYNYFRDYDPSLGRYSESDPLGLKAGLNTYLYVNASPLRASDSLGLGEGCDFIPDRFETPCRLVCCTFHDQCWTRHRCDMRSWCPGQGSAACVRCNRDAVECFVRCGVDGRGTRGR